MKRLISILTIILLTLTVVGCNTAVPANGTDEYAISIFFESEELTIGSTTEQKFARIRMGADVSPEDIVAVSSDPDIATAVISEESDSSYIYYSVTGVNAGTAYIHFETSDGTVCSDKIEIYVLPDTCGPSSLPDSTATSDNTDETATKTSGADSPATPADPTGTDDATLSVVYVTPTGSKYHLSKNCAGKNAIEKSPDEVSDSYEPCKKCAF